MVHYGSGVQNFMLEFYILLKMERTHMPANTNARKPTNKMKWNATHFCIRYLKTYLTPNELIIMKHELIIQYHHFEI